MDRIGGLSTSATQQSESEMRGIHDAPPLPRELLFAFRYHGVLHAVAP